MPIYEYRCEHGHTFEVMQRISDDPVSACQTCASPIERVFHPVAVHFKGSGFYNTDYGTRKRARELKDSAESSSTKADSAEPDSKSSSEKDKSPAKPASDSKSSTAASAAKSD